jgi:hypothetical protein
MSEPLSLGCICDTRLPPMGFLVGVAILMETGEAHPVRSGFGIGRINESKIMHLGALLFGLIVLGWGLISVDCAAFMLRFEDDEFRTDAPFADRRGRAILAVIILPIPLLLVAGGFASAVWGLLDG